MTRRALLTLLLAMLGLGIVRWVRDVRERAAPQASLGQQLREYFGYLQLDDAVLGAFVRDYLADTTRARRGERIEAVGARFLLSLRRLLRPLPFALLQPARGIRCLGGRVSPQRIHLWSTVHTRTESR